MFGFSTERRFRLFVSGAILNIRGESYRLKGKRQAGLFPSFIWPSRNASVVLRRVGLDEAAVAVGQVQYEAVDLALHPADDHQGLAKVALGVARRMGQRHEHLLGLTAILSDVVLDRGISDVESVFVPERSKMRLAVWRCFLRRLRSSSRSRSMTPA